MSQVFDATGDTAAQPHVVRRLGLVAREAGDLLEGELSLRRDLRVPGTHVPLLGVLGSFCDTIGGVVAAIGSFPTAVATADLTVAVDPRAAPSSVVTRPAILRAGRTAVVTEMWLVDGTTGTRCGYCTMSSTVLSSSRPQVVDPRIVTRYFADAYAPRAEHFYDDIGVSAEGAGRVSLALEPFLGNAMGMLHGGVTVILAEAAACSAARAHSFGEGEAIAALEAQVRYLNGAREGPVVAEGEIVAAGDGWVTVHVVQRDAARGRATSTAVVRVGRLDTAGPAPRH